MIEGNKINYVDIFIESSEIYEIKSIEGEQNVINAIADLDKIVKTSTDNITITNSIKELFIKYKATDTY